MKRVAIATSMGGRTFVFGRQDPWGTIEPTGIQALTKNTGNKPRKASEGYAPVRVIPFNGVGLATTTATIPRVFKVGISIDQASQEFSVVYKDILLEFIEDGKGQLSLPPISTHVLTVKEMAIVTRKALKLAVLSIPRARSLCGKPIQLNIFEASDFEVFRDAMFGFRAELTTIMECGSQESINRTPAHTDGARCCRQTGKRNSLALWMSDLQQITKQTKEDNKGSFCLLFCESMVCPSHWKNVDEKKCNPARLEEVSEMPHA